MNIPIVLPQNSETPGMEEQKRFNPALKKPQWKGSHIFWVVLGEPGCGRTMTVLGIEVLCVEILRRSCPLLLDANVMPYQFQQEKTSQQAINLSDVAWKKTKSGTWRSSQPASKPSDWNFLEKQDLPWSLEWQNEPQQLVSLEPASGAGDPVWPTLDHTICVTQMQTEGWWPGAPLWRGTKALPTDSHTPVSACQDVSSLSSSAGYVQNSEADLNSTWTCGIGIRPDYRFELTFTEWGPEGHQSGVKECSQTASGGRFFCSYCSYWWKPWAVPLA